ncbi:MAG: hypothetical protein JST40_00005 [Armatimonadetes bacterium]|nr:hypothetical protein [Armatimonadota bacterium]
MGTSVSKSSKNLALWVLIGLFALSWGFVFALDLGGSTLERSLLLFSGLVGVFVAGGIGVMLSFAVHELGHVIGVWVCGLKLYQVVVVGKTLFGRNKAEPAAKKFSNYVAFLAPKATAGQLWVVIGFGPLASLLGSIAIVQLSRMQIFGNTIWSGYVGIAAFTFVIVALVAGIFGNAGNWEGSDFWQLARLVDSTPVLIEQTRLVSLARMYADRCSWEMSDEEFAHYNSCLSEKCAAIHYMRFVRAIGLREEQEAKIHAQRAFDLALKEPTWSLGARQGVWAMTWFAVRGMADLELSRKAMSAAARFGITHYESWVRLARLVAKGRREGAEDLAEEFVEHLETIECSDSDKRSTIRVLEYVMAGKQTLVPVPAETPDPQ